MSLIHPFKRRPRTHIEKREQIPPNLGVGQRSTEAFVNIST